MLSYDCVCATCFFRCVKSRFLCICGSFELFVFAQNLWSFLSCNRKEKLQKFSSFRWVLNKNFDVSAFSWRISCHKSSLKMAEQQRLPDDEVKFLIPSSWVVVVHCSPWLELSSFYLFFKCVNKDRPMTHLSCVIHTLKRDQMEFCFQIAIIKMPTRSWSKFGHNEEIFKLFLSFSFGCRSTWRNNMGIK